MYMKKKDNAVIMEILTMHFGSDFHILSNIQQQNSSKLYSAKSEQQALFSSLLKIIIDTCEEHS